MIRKYCYGTPFETEAVTASISLSTQQPAFGSISLQDGFCFSLKLSPQAMVFGLGESNRGINKRGFLYISDCADDQNMSENRNSSYAAHNFILVSDDDTHTGLFFDYPGTVRFDIGFTRTDTMTVTCEQADLYLYVITGTSDLDVVRQFRQSIGRSYLPPKFAFGYGQSRFGYKTPEDFRTVVRKHRENHIPIDLLYMDIDYMDTYKDFTVNEEAFPAFDGFVREMQKDHIHLAPIIDAGVKIEKGYKVYEEGREKGYFCRRKDGSYFEATVWPGWSHFPDVLNKDARKWFGDQYDFLISKGIDAFWNDMNEPSIFFSRESIAKFKDYLHTYMEEDNPGIRHFQLMKELFSLANSHEDYQRFYHNADGRSVCHEQVHNLYGYNMTRAAGEAFERLSPHKRILLFSRSSYIGMHRYGGTWTGDNSTWWSHILLNLKMMPSLNMCGFLYAGADLGGFAGNTSRDLLLRWLALGVFTPLMRNHTASNTREQEVYQFEDIQDFRAVIEVRYRLIPYLYSEYMKAALGNDMMFKPLAFVYPKDPIARNTEDQLILGDEIMIAPVYTQNAIGRTVYLPEEMLFVKLSGSLITHREILPQGVHYVQVALNEVPLFIRRDRCIPLADPAECVPEIREESIVMLGYEGASYERYDDDGISPL